MPDIQVISKSSYFLILNSLFHITIECQASEGCRFTCYRQNVNCFVACSILILDILPNRSWSKVPIRFQILFSSKELKRHILPHVAYVSLSQFHSF